MSCDCEHDYMVKAMCKAVQISGNAILVTDDQGNIVYVNDALLEITGYEREELIGQNPRIFKTDQFDKDYYQELWGTLISGKEWSGEFLNQRKDGSTFWEFAVIAPIKDKDGKVYYVGVKENITRVKELEERLVQQAERVERVNIATKRNLNCF